MGLLALWFVTEKTNILLLGHVTLQKRRKVYILVGVQAGDVLCLDGFVSNPTKFGGGGGGNCPTAPVCAGPALKLFRRVKCAKTFDHQCCLEANMSLMDSNWNSRVVFTKYVPAIPEKLAQEVGPSHWTYWLQILSQFMPSKGGSLWKLWNRGY